MENLLTNLQTIQLAFLVSMFYQSIDESVKEGSLVKNVLRLLDIGILIGATYLSFVNYKWWKAILLIVVLFAISSIAGIYIKRYLGKQTILVVSVIGLFFTAYTMFLKIF